MAPEVEAPAAQQRREFGAGTALASLRRMTHTAMWRARGVSLVLGGLTAALVPGHRAQACGGFFCNQPSPNPFDPPPVAQTAENVLFAMEKDAAGVTHLEAHVQIFYAGPADRFS